MEQIEKTDKIFMTGEQVEEIDECLDYLNGYISALSIIGNGCFNPNIDFNKYEVGMALMGLSKEADRKWTSIQTIITDEVREQIKKQKEEVSHD